MKDLFRIVSHRFSKNKKKAVSTLAVIVTFVMVYTLIMPAVALERKAAENEPGMALEETVSEDAMAEAESETPEAETAPAEETEPDAEAVAADESAAEEVETESDVPASAPAADNFNAAADSSAAEQTVSTTADQGTTRAADVSEYTQTETEAAPSASDAGKTDAEEGMPAQSFEQIVKFNESIDENGNPVEKQVKVKVDAEDNAFPAGTVMKAEVVLNNIDPQRLQDMEDAITAAVKKAAGESGLNADDTRIVQYQAIDIHFFNKEGQKIEPAKKVEVRITSDKIREIANPVLVHVNENDKTGEIKDADVIEKKDIAVIDEKPDTVANNENTMLFKTSRFSPFVIVESETVDENGEIMNGLEGEYSSEASFELADENDGTGNNVAADGSGVLMTSDGDYNVTVTYDANANIPANAELQVKEITEASRAYQNYMEEAKDVLEDDAASINYAKIFDVDIVSDGEVVTPEAEVDVDIAYKNSEEIEEGTVVQAVQFGEGVPAVNDDAFVYGDETHIDGVQMKAAEIPVTAIVGTGTITAPFVAGDGSTYEVTVTYGDDAQIPEGAELRVREITEAAEHQEYVDKTQEAIGRETDDSNARFFDISIVDRDGNEIQPAAAVSVKIRLIDTEITDSTQVVHFGKTAELMDLQRTSDTLNFQTDGFSVFAVVVVESEEGSYVFRGEGYTVTVTYTAEAQIPLGTILTVEELDPESDEYIQRLGQAWDEVNREYFEVEEMRANYNEGMGDLPELPLINLDQARFFNISLKYEDEEIEPEVPVQVEIAYDDGMTMVGEAVSGVTHFTGDEVELIDEVDTVTEGNNVLAFKYEQTSIADTGTYVGQKTYDEVAERVVLPAPEPMQYPMLQTKAAATKGLKAAGNGDGEEGEEEEGEGEDIDLAAPIATKTLTPNKAGNTNDGTYTLELAVDGRAKSSITTEIKKSNVLIVMDRSSSMINNLAWADVTQVAHYERGRYYSGSNGYTPWTPTAGVTYYGQIYSNGENRYRELFYNNGQFYYYDSQGVTTATTRSYTGNIYTSKTRTRLDEEQEALDKLIYDLLAKNGEGTTDDGVSLEDIVEISVISFAKDRMDENDGTAHPSSEQDWSTSYTALMEAVNDPYAPSGTNWEQALKYAMDQITAKKQDPTQAGEDYYLIFLTDGEPTATTTHHSGAYYYGNNASDYMPAYEAARNYVRDVSGIAATEDIHFYGIMTWATNNIMREFLKRLVNVGNGNVTNETDFTTEAVDEDGVDDYYYDADSLEKLAEAFEDIFNLISDSVAYEQVSITDGLTTDAMTTTLVNGSASGFQYTVYKNRVVDADGKVVSKGTPVYTVTATDVEGGEPNVTFHINGTEYTANTTPAVQKKTYEYEELQEDGTTLVHKTKDYYSVTVGEGENAVEYKMTLADKTEGRLDWDLAGIGALEDGYTYAVSFTVWPDQDAYDYVAALNNGLEQITDSNGDTVDVTWDSNVETDANKVTDSNGRSYWKNGALPDYPSIIKYTDGTYAVLTNTDQSLKYTITKTEQVDDNDPIVTHEGPYTTDLPTPDPMPLTGTASQLEKVWNINRDPSILYKYLYESKDTDGNPVAFDIGFEIDQDGEEYKQVHLPGEATVTTDGVTYDWSAYETGDLVEYNGKTFSKRWSQDFSIATGLMLSETQMDARNLDKSLYNDKKYKFNDIWYYVLEPGHDFKISEPAVGYEFDFEEPTYHPMLVDGVLMDVKFTTEDGTKSITGMEALEIDTTGKSALTVFNTLRGYINVHKKVVDSDGTTPLTTDNTEFTFAIELTNAMPVFEGDHIPWYGVNGLYYHDADADDDYYQAEYLNGKLQVTTEEGGPYEGVGHTFNPDYAGEQTIKYLVDGQEKTVTICGNQMTPTDGSGEDGYKKVTGTAKITQSETLYIANVPVNTHYTIKETGLAALGYQLIDIDREVGTSGTAPGGSISVQDANITGEIIQNTETLITYTNKCLVTDITLQKTDDKGDGLEGAVFRLVKVGETGQSESDASLIDSVSGLDEISKTVNGETKTYTSAFESNGEVQTINGLPDGTYRLYEVVVPAGYINTYRYIQFDIESRSIKNVTTDTEDTSKLIIDENNIDLIIKNEPGAALPHTGGPGTLPYALSGIALMMASALMYGFRMRRRERRLN